MSHGCVKAEAIAAEQLMRLLLEESDASVRLASSAAQPGKAAVSSISASTTSPRDAAVAASTAESRAALPPAAAKDSAGSGSARAAVAAADKAANAIGVTATPRPATELVDYDIFEQTWMADLTAAVPKAG